jgi:hypothetical protein
MSKFTKSMKDTGMNLIECCTNSLWYGRAIIDFVKRMDWKRSFPSSAALVTVAAPVIIPSFVVVSISLFALDFTGTLGIGIVRVGYNGMLDIQDALRGIPDDIQEKIKLGVLTTSHETILTKLEHKNSLPSDCSKNIQHDDAKFTNNESISQTNSSLNLTGDESMDTLSDNCSATLRF